MLEAFLTELTVAVLAISVVLLFRWRHVLSSRLPYHPGPKPSLVSGNELPTALPWLKYTQLAKEYGPIIQLRSYHEHIVIVNTVDDAIALFEKRSRIYSDRPHWFMTELMGWDFNAGLIRYGDKWRRHRRLFHQNYSKTMVRKTQEPTQIVKVRECLKRVLLAPDQVTAHFRILTAGIVMATVYDKEISESEVDRFAVIADVAGRKLADSFSLGAIAANSVPFLRRLPGWLPGIGFKRRATECRAYTDELKNLPLQYVKEKMNAGIEVSSLAARLLQQKIDDPSFKHEEEDIKGVLATSFAGGAGTTLCALENFIYAMVTHPHAQNKAQKEIDAIIGNERLPDFNDRPSLPYLEAVYREVMRWHPVTPLGISHTPSEDDIYNGYFIPKGANVLPNIWAMTHDEQRYPQPDRFMPERFFDRNGKLDDDDTVLSYGFGRRICPGRHMASSAIWLVMSSMLATFTISKAKDENGNEIPIDDTYSSDFISQKLPYRCSITPRSPQARQLILDAN